MRVECSKSLSRDYPVGTKFRIKAKLTDKEEGGEFLYSYFEWKFEVSAVSRRIAHSVEFSGCLASFARRCR